VDLRKRTCGYRKWEVIGIPCAHAHFAITFHGHKLEDYVYYTIEMYKKTYAPNIQCPIRNSGQRPGRHRKARVRAPDESRDSNNPYRIRKFGLKSKCGF
jgi:hypothetical protein